MTSSCGSRTGSVAQQHAVQQAEDGGVGADAERQRGDRDGVKPGLAAKNADGVTEILLNHVAMLPEGGGDEIAQRARPDRGDGEDAPSRRGVAQVAAWKAPSICSPYSWRNGAG